MIEHIKERWYLFDTKLMLHGVEEQNESLLCHHSEELAIAFGLIRMSCGTPLCITRNLRMCSDCHIAAKYISEVVGWDLYVRDSCQFHSFKQGLCSCGDNW